jgi:hypothetical protein
MHAYIHTCIPWSPSAEQSNHHSWQIRKLLSRTDLLLRYAGTPGVCMYVCVYVRMANTTFFLEQIFFYAMQELLVYACMYVCVYVRMANT